MDQRMMVHFILNSDTMTTHQIVLDAGPRHDTNGGRAADRGFPSVPKGGLTSRPSNASTDASYAADYAAAAALSGNLSDDSSTADGQPPRFAPGQKVLYDSFEQPLPVQGTVAKIDRAGILMVTLGC